MSVKTLSDVIKFDNEFKTAVNLYLSLNKIEKVNKYIPTKSSIAILNDFFVSILENKEKECLLVGPYGKGKSHLLLVLLAVISMERNEENYKVIKQLEQKINDVEGETNDVVKNIETIWNNKRFLPVVINDTSGDLNQAFLMGMKDALNREGLIDLVPETYFSAAKQRIDEWEKLYPDTYLDFNEKLKEAGCTLQEMKAELEHFSKEALALFKSIYPQITSGSTFNPFDANNFSDLKNIYKAVGDLLVEEYGYSGIYIVFDEFSKFIEGINENGVGSTMNILQGMCEWVAESSNIQTHITMVAHKSIKEYGKYLSQEIINGFTGIEGRMVEKYFVTSSKNNYELIKNAIIKNTESINGIPNIELLLGEKRADKYYQLPVFRSNFERDDFDKIVFKGCYPLNPIAACILLNISEKVAQNERTLFTFVSKDEPCSMARYISEHDAKMGWTIGADLVYDYFSSLFKKDVANELIHNIWLAAEYALTKCINEDEKKVIKALAVLLIINKEEELPSNEKYISLAVSIADSNDAIKGLVDRNIIYKKASSETYVFKTRAGSELKAELKKQRAIKGDSANYSEALRSITGKYYIIPRKYNSIHMMTRYFIHEYMDVEVFLSMNNSNVLFSDIGAADGKVITLYSFNPIELETIKKHYNEIKTPKLIVVLPQTHLDCAREIKDYEILQGIRNNQVFISDNEILKKELPLLEEDLIRVVQNSIGSAYYNNGTDILCCNKEKELIENINSEEMAVNKACSEVYYKTPIINNEMINRTAITTAQTKKARINIIDAIISHNDDDEFYAGTNQEATIYRALFLKTGIKSADMQPFVNDVVSIIENFIDSCIDSKQSIVQLIDELTAEPYGIRKGVIPCYLAYILSKRKEDVVGYFADVEIPINAEAIVNMCESPEKYTLFVSKKDFLKEQYIENCNKLFSIKENIALSDNRLNNIVVCMQRWFRSLPQIARNVSGISMYVEDSTVQKNMRELRRLLQKVEYNPYELLFVDIPKRFDSESLIETFEQIQLCKKYYDEYIDWAVQNATSGIYDVFGGQRKLELYHVLKEWHEKQSDLSKQGLHSSSITNFMSCIEKLDVYSDADITQKIIKAVTNIYIENWIDDAYENFISELKTIKKEVEQIREEKTEGKLLLSFVGRKGEKIEKYYEKVSEDTGIVLRNIIEDTLDEFDDLSVNDRVGILLEMIEKIIG